MRMLVTVEFADAGVKTGTHRVLVVGGSSDMAAPGDIGMSLEEAQTTLSRTSVGICCGIGCRDHRACPSRPVRSPSKSRSCAMRRRVNGMFRKRTYYHRAAA